MAHSDPSLRYTAHRDVAFFNLIVGSVAHPTDF
jgi:hypothetical protein